MTSNTRVSPAEWLAEKAQHGHFRERCADAGRALAEAYDRADSGNRRRLIERVIADAIDYLERVDGISGDEAGRVSDDLAGSCVYAIEAYKSH